VDLIKNTHSDDGDKPAVVVNLRLAGWNDVERGIEDGRRPQHATGIRDLAWV
jgi:hypothetical protein